MSSAAQKHEVHEHCFIRGPRARAGSYKFSHSHADSSVPHDHPETGPACYTIDKDDWFRTTGLCGGGRKKFTVKPSGEQFASMRARAEEEQSFNIIVCPPPKDFDGTGGGMETAARMVLGFGMTANVRKGGRS